MDFGAWVLVVALVGAVLFGLTRTLLDGRFRGTHKVRGAEKGDQSPTHHTSPDQRGPAVPAQYVDDLGQRATLLQFSSAFCAPCRATRSVLSEVARVVPGVAHVEIDAEQHLQLVRDLGVLRTPTTLILDAQGLEKSRASGALKRDAVMNALDSALKGTE